jgi:hypothetical protein
VTFPSSSYGSPLGSVNTNINPRLPGGSATSYVSSGSEPKISVVKPDGTKVIDLRADGANVIEDKKSDVEVGDELEEDANKPLKNNIELSEPGYE